MTNYREVPPVVTVLMAVYNGGMWLGESITSVLSQTFSDFEFIIVNDGSTDDSAEIIAKFAEIDSRIRVFNKLNSGLADSLNFGLAKANGKWVARIDADDVSHADRLRKQLDHTLSDSTLVLVGSGLVLIDEGGVQGQKYYYPKIDKSIKKRLSRGLSFFPHSSAFYKLSAVKKIGGYRTQFHRAQDQDLWLRLTEVGKISCVGQVLVSIRKHSQQISRDESGRIQEIYSHMAMTSYHLRLIGSDDPVLEGDEAATKCFYNFIENHLNSRNFFEDRKVIEYIKADVAKQGYRNMKLIVLAKNFLFNLIVSYRYLSFRCFGSNLPKILARKWGFRG